MKTIRKKEKAALDFLAALNRARTLNGLNHISGSVVETETGERALKFQNEELSFVVNVRGVKPFLLGVEFSIKTLTPESEVLGRYEAARRL